MKKKLLAYGFVEVKKFQNYSLLELAIHGEDDRFRTVLHWYSDQSKKIYINVSKLSGAQTISESDLFADTNELYSGALDNWKKFRDAFPQIEAV